MQDTKKINIAHVIGHLKFGGAENQVLHIINGLDRAEFNKHLILFDGAKTHYRNLIDDSVTVSDFNLTRWGQIPCIIRMYQYFKKHRIKIVQAHMFHANLYSVIAARLAQVPVILTTEHGKNLWKNLFHHYLERTTISPLSTKRIAVSNDIKGIRVKSGDIPENKIIVMPNCVQVSRLNADKRAQNTIHIGTVGRLVSAKNYQNLLESIALLSDKNLPCHLTIVGDGPERQKLEKISVNLGIKKIVSFAGFQSDINSFLDDFDIFALSSIREGIPVSMLEAMARQIPVVSTAVGGIPEVIDNFHNGILVSDHNPENFANALEKLICDENLRYQIASRGRETVSLRYSTEAVCLAYKKLYKALINQSRF